MSVMSEQMTGNLTITSVKRVRGRAVLTLSTGETLFMPRAMLKERPYKSGMPFNLEKHESFIAARAYPFAMEKAVAFLATRARTEKELVDVLTENAYPEQAIARVMAYLTDAGYMNDAAYAQQWAASRSGKSLGARRIRMELRLKGVSQEEIDEALSSVDEDAMLDGAVKAAEKFSRGKDLSSPADRQKIMAALARRGYDYAIARQAIEQIRF